MAVSSLKAGGAERNVLRYARALSERGHDVAVLAGPGPLAAELLEAGITHIESSTLLSRPWTVLATATRLSRFARNRPVDIVHSFMASTSVAAAIASRILSATAARSFRLIVAPPGIGGPPEEPAWRGRLRMWTFGLGADLILSASPQLRSALREAGVSESRIRSVNFNAVEPAEFDAAPSASWRRDHGIAPTDRLVTSIARLDPVKDQDLLIRAAPQVLAVLPEAMFALVGEGPRRGHLEQLAASLGVGGRVRFLGYQSDVASVLANSEVLVQTTLGAGGPGLSVLEAFAAGCPVVAIEFPDLRDAIGSSGAALLAAERDPGLLAESLLAVLTDPGRASRMAVAGRGLIESRFSLAAATMELQALYEEVRRKG